MLKMSRVVWRDAQDYLDTWVESAKVDAFADADYVVESIGYVVRKTDKYLTIAGDWDEHEKNWGTVRKIPVAMIQSIEEVVIVPT